MRAVLRTLFLATVTLGATLPLGDADARGRRCKRGDKLIPLKYTHGGQVFIPARVSCGGTVPVIIMLHGNNASNDKHPSLGGGRNLDRLVGKYVRRGFIRPIVLAEPVHHGACKADRAGLPAVFGAGFSFAVYKQKLMRVLRRHGIRPASWSLVAHSGSGCCGGAGIFAASQVFPKLYLFGTSDTCYGSKFYGEFIHRKFFKTRTRVVNACRGYPSYSSYREYETQVYGKRPRKFRCDRTYYKHCIRHRLRRWYAYVTKPRTVRSHTQVFTEFMKTILFKHFRRGRRR